VVFDACEKVATRPRLKKGYVTSESVKDYDDYKLNVRKLFFKEYLQCEPRDITLKESSGEAEYGIGNNTTPVPFTVSSTDDDRLSFIDAQGRRLGFGLAVRSALRIVKTPYVWVHQHDWALIEDIPLASILDVMQASDSEDQKPVKYVCLPSGRRISYATSDQVMLFEQLRKLSVTLTGNYMPPNLQSDAVPLTPMFFWHDKPHIAQTSHYLQRIFPTRLAMMRGAFIEDTVGQRARNQMKEGQWAKWATWLYNIDNGKKACVRHLHGRTWRGTDEVHPERISALLRASKQPTESDDDMSHFREQDLDTEIYGTC
jgi:hypothetical protein